ncbi:MAG TPA: SurA N-terminal domain-containing protein [Gammaproteobacteria bacterium]|jgi:peptidyl-prolyl cis-trans isomerase D
MLIQAFRDNVPKWITGVILALLVIPFALWGINSYFTASSDNSVATVNGDPITPGDYQRAYQNQYQRLQQLYGAAFKPELIDEKKLHEQTIEMLVNATLLNQQIVKDHYTVGDAQLVESIQQMPEFQADGKFSPQAYHNVLASVGLNPEQFEHDQRQQIVVERFEGSVQNSAVATPAEFDAQAALQGQQRQIDYLAVSSKRFLADAKASDADIQAYYKAHQAEFMTPEKVSLSYVELDEAQLAKEAQPTDADLQALYQQQIDKYKQDETRTARHILIAVNGSDPKADAAAKAKADDILKQIKAGGDFAKLAAQYSDDKGSGRKGGELGDVPRGEMVKPFEQALFGMTKPGEIVGPIRTQFGYHIIQLEKINAGTQKSFAEVKPQLIADYQKKTADDKYFALGDQLANLAYEHPQSLDEVSKQLNLPIQTVDDVTRDAGTMVGANPDVRKAAFSDSLLTQGNNSEPIQLGPNHAVVIRVKGHTPSEAIPLDQVKEKIAVLVKQQQASDATTKLAASLLDGLKKGGDPAALAKSAPGVTLVSPGFVARDQKDVPPQILATAFSTPAPATGARSYSNVALADGDQAVLVLSAIKPGDAGAITAQDRLTAMNRMSRQDGTQEFAAYIAYLRDQGKVMINTKNLDQSDQ